MNFLKRLWQKLFGNNKKRKSKGISISDAGKAPVVKMNRRRKNKKLIAAENLERQRTAWMTGGTHSWAKTAAARHKN